MDTDPTSSERVAWNLTDNLFFWSLSCLFIILALLCYLKVLDRVYFPQIPSTEKAAKLVATNTQLASGVELKLPACQHRLIFSLLQAYPFAKILSLF
jgi:hypothetical protein